jgi:hypothetical protein
LVRFASNITLAARGVSAYAYANTHHALWAYHLPLEARA